MSVLIVDASVVVKWFVPEIQAPDAQRVLATDRTVYDAMYLALAIRLKTRLITADRRLANAIRAIPMIAPHVQFIAG